MAPRSTLCHARAPLARASLVTALVSCAVSAGTAAAQSAAAPCVGPVIGSLLSVHDAQLTAPYGVAVVRDTGDVVVSDTTTSRILTLADSAASSVAVLAGVSASDALYEFTDMPRGAPATLAPLAQARGVAVLGGADVVFADTDNSAVFRVSGADNTLTTLLPQPLANAPWPPDGTPAAHAHVLVPWGVAADAGGNVFVSYPFYYRIAKVSASNASFSTLAGTGDEGWSGDGGPATAAELEGPMLMAAAPDGSILFSDFGNALRAVQPNGTIVSLLGTPTNPPTAFGVGVISGVAVGDDGAVFIADSSLHRVWRVLQPGENPTLLLVAGTGEQGHTGDGGPATLAALAAPAGIAIDSAGRLYVAERTGFALRRVDTGTGSITTVAGVAPPAPGASALHATLNPIAVSAVGDAALVAVTQTGRVLFASLNDTWALRVIAGNGLFAGSNLSTIGDGGPATAAPLCVALADPLAANAAACAFVAAAPSGDVYVSEPFCGRVRRIRASDARIDTVIGTGEVAADGSVLAARLPTGARGAGTPATAADVGSPLSLAVDAAGGVWFTYGSVVTDYHCGVTGGRAGYGVRGVAAFDPATGLARHVACSPTRGFSGDGPATSVDCNDVFVGDVDAGGNVYLADLGNHVIRVIDAATGGMRTLVGSGGAAGFAGDGGPATLARLDSPKGVRVAPGAAGAAATTLVINDWGNGRVRVAVVDGGIVTAAGTGVADAGIVANGVPATSAALVFVQDLALDAAGNALLVLMPGTAVVALTLGATIPCPAGYACPCGTPVACTDAASFCAGNTLRPFPATVGYYTLPEAPAGERRTAQAPCPPGSFCVNGTRTPCLPGTLGALARRSTAGACSACPPGSYAASGAGSACMPCPAGTYAAAPGAALCTACVANTSSAARGATTAAACTPCAAGTAALPGSDACFDAAGATFGVAAGVASVELPPPPPAAPPSVVLLQLTVTGAVLAAAVGAIAVGVCVRAAVQPRRRRASAATPPAPATVAGCCRTAKEAADLYALHHLVAVGRSPVRTPTRLGVALSFLACAVLAALGAALYIQFAQGNELVQRAVLPASLAVLSAAAGDAFAALPAPRAGVAPGAASGVVVEVRVAGPACAAAAWASTEAFAYAVATDAATLASVHTFACPRCRLSPLSALTLTLDAGCQSVGVRTTAVTSEGVALVSGVVLAGPPARASAADAVLARLDVAAPATLEVFSAGHGAPVLRGYRVAIQSAAATLGAAPPAVVVAVALPLQATYYGITVVPLQTTAQFLSQLVGLLGVFTVFAAVQRVKEAACSPAAAAAATRALRACRLVRRPPVLRHGPSGGSPGGSGRSGDSAPSTVSGATTSSERAVLSAAASRADRVAGTPVTPPAGPGPGGDCADASSASSSSSSSQRQLQRALRGGGNGEPTARAGFTPSAAAVTASG